MNITDLKNPLAGLEHLVIKKNARKEKYHSFTSGNSHYQQIRLNTRKQSCLEKYLFPIDKRNFSCLHPQINHLVGNTNLGVNYIRQNLSYCPTIEHQIVRLSTLVQQDREDFERRHAITSKLLDCIYKHHGTVYEGLMFGSTINGLGFKNSDVDLRLRPLRKITDKQYEPVVIDRQFAELILRDIAFQTCKCCTVDGNFVPSVRCPLAKLVFYKTPFSELRERPLRMHCQEGIMYDISLSSESLGSFNSTFLRFLCQLEPKFHILAMTLRYWAKSQDLVSSGLMSSYALINMLILFCQVTEKPLLPSVDKMREVQLNIEDEQRANEQQDIKNVEKKGILFVDWQCKLCMDPSKYERSANDEPLSVLLLKFFEMFVNYPYTSQILSIRQGRLISIKEFKESEIFDDRYTINDFVNMQDPFDLRHNLSAGWNSSVYFHSFYYKLYKTYKILYKELVERFDMSGFGTKDSRCNMGLNAIFKTIRVPPLSPDAGMNKQNHTNEKSKLKAEKRRRKRRKKNLVNETELDKEQIMA